MGQKILARMGVLRKARPAMSRLVRQCNESVYFVVRRNDYVLMLDLVDTTQQVKVASLVGQRFSLATTAGRLFAAYDGVSGSNGRKRGDVPGGESLTVLERESIRAAGCCGDQQGFGEGVASLAVPLFNAKNEVVAVLAILGPDFRFSPGRIDTELLPQLQEAGRSISGGLGFLGDYLNRNSVSEIM
jgi:DNA-binding IclR family transcriptional regulator